MAILPLVGSKKRLDPQTVKQIVGALGLKLSELPASQGRIHRSRSARA